MVAHLWHGTEFSQGTLYMSREGQNPTSPQDQIAHWLKLTESWSFFLSSQAQKGTRWKGEIRAVCQGPPSMSKIFPVHWRQRPVKEKLQGHIFVMGMSNLQKYCHKPQATSQGCSLRFMICLFPSHLGQLFWRTVLFPGYLLVRAVDVLQLESWLGCEYVSNIQKQWAHAAYKSG